MGGSCGLLINISCWLVAQHSTSSPLLMIISPDGRVAVKVSHDDSVFCGGLNEVESDWAYQGRGGR